ncbi:CBS domain-containing protein [Propionivibrio limicola]|uniref:CBS domain-containing protein n=1 Tax=Propionivibrio limicola TaxID=167645 RepID=UPI0012910D37|nr:CBS domain-containing protein [Propionivibrio limicola]
MFSLYGISGPIVQGTVESLARLPAVRRRGPVTGTPPVGGEYDESLQRATLAGLASTQTTATPGDQATAAYRSMLPESLERGPLYHANQIMQPEVITLNADDDVTRAWRMLVRHKIHQAPVLDRENHLIGIVSERNLLTTLNVEGGEVRDALARRVGDVMTTPVVAASPTTDIRRIAQVMVDYGVDGVPIVNETGHLLGFISRTDILNAVVTDPPLSVWR